MNCLVHLNFRNVLGAKKPKNSLETINIEDLVFKKIYLVHRS